MSDGGFKPLEASGEAGEVSGAARLDVAKHKPTFYIAMIGDSSTVRGFAAGGVHAYPAANSEQALTTLRELLAGGRYAIIFITEALAEPILDTISRLRTGTVPAVIIVPDQSGARGIGFEKIRLAVERAIGIDLLGQARQRQAESNAATTTS